MTRNVLFIAPSAYTIGGVQSWLDYIVPGLANCGWDPVVGLVSGRLHSAKAYLCEHPFEKVCIIPSTTGTREGRIRGLVRALREFRPDMVVVSNIVDAYLAVSRFRATMRQDVRVVAALHGMAPDFLQDFERYRDHVDAIISINLLGCDLVEQVCGLAPDRIFHAAGGVEVPDDRTLGIRRQGWGQEPLRMAFVGRFESYYKRVHDALDIAGAAISAGLALKLTMAGDGPERESLLALARDKGIEDNVEFLVGMDQQGLRDRVYSCCDVLLLTSYSETGPLVAWEAMAHGMVLVTSDFVGRKREGCLRDGVNCCVFPIGETSKAVECLFRVRDPEVRSPLAAAGRELVRQHYARSVSVRRWSDCLETIAKLPPLPTCPIRDCSPPQGRLDRIFGPSLAESVRRQLGRAFTHTDPGGEWPHSYGDRPADDPEFWAMARQLDVAGSAAA